VRETGQGGGDRMYDGAKSGAQHMAGILALHTAKWQPLPSRQQLEELAAQAEGWAGGCNAVLGTIKLGSPAWEV
jgi:hypothetical protein